MSKSFLYLALLTITSLSFTSCEKDQQKENDDSLTVESLIPISTGNYWTYKSTNYNMGKENIDTTITKVGEEIRINGITCFAFIDEQSSNTKFIGGSDSFGNFVTYGGILNNDTIFKPSVQFKKTATVGEQWDYTMVSYSRSDSYEKLNVDIIPIKCISADTLINTPIGNFQCKAFEISINSGDHTFRYYISTDTGIVKTEHYDGKKLFSFGELIDFRINRLCK